MDKKKYIWIGLGIVVLISLFIPVGGGDDKPEKELIIRAKQTEVKGDLKGCFEVVDKDYRVKFDRYYDIVTVELKRTNEELPYDRDDVVIFPEGNESSASQCAGFGIEILDEYGDVIEKINANATPYSWDEMTTAIQLRPEDTTTIAFHFSDGISDAASFRVTSLVMKNEKKIDKRSRDDEQLFDELDEIAKEVEDIYDDEDIDELMETYDDALEMTKKSMELASDMLQLL